MHRPPVRSSNIRSVGHDPASSSLQVEFHNGGIYQYSGVPETVYQGLMQASSKGIYFHNHIKDRYPCRQVR
ncbi:MAG: KTSC domain-containing protein [Planctomycetota bacterium]